MNKTTDETAEPILMRNISKRVSLREVRTFRGQNNIFTILGGQNLPKLPKIGPNRHFAAKSAKSWSSHISVIDEAIRVKFDRQIENGKKYPKSAKLGQKGHVWITWRTFRILGPPNISGSFKARNFKFGMETDGSEF